MSDELIIIVGTTIAGRVIRTGGELELRYDDSYRSQSQATPLSVSLPLAAARHTHAAVSPWMEGLLPDDPAVLRRWGRMFSVSTSPFSLLSTPIGEECAGGARFITPDRVEHALAGDGDVEWLAEADVAQRLRDLKADSTAWLGTTFTGRFSLAGAQAKTALLWDDATDRWGVPSGTAATSHILKPAITGLDDHDLNEHLCLRAATQLGLVCAPTQIKNFDDQSAIVSTRYDRIPGEPWLRRVHQEDTCQALGKRPELRYQNDGGPGTTDIVRLLRRVAPATRAIVDVWRFFDAATFNWLIAGTDAHAKNYSLLLSGNQVRLAPLYDVASALPYATFRIRKLRLAMKYGHSYLLDGRRNTVWLRVAQEFSLPAEQLRDRAEWMADRVTDAFSTVAAQRDVATLGMSLPATLVDQVENRIKDLRGVFD
jgi:serine/threonine-protein kinase HipA